MVCEGNINIAQTISISLLTIKHQTAKTFLTTLEIEENKKIAPDNLGVKYSWLSEVRNYRVS